MKESWANVNRKGHRNSAHNHLTATLSGCYYIQSGFDDAELAAERGKATALEFLPPPADPGGSDGDDGVARPELEPWSHEALGAAGTLAHSSKLTVSCSNSFSQSNSVPYVWTIRYAGPMAGPAQPLCAGAPRAAGSHLAGVQPSTECVR